VPLDAEHERAAIAALVELLAQHFQAAEHVRPQADPRSDL
jgi:hypothetical protein